MKIKQFYSSSSDIYQIKHIVKNVCAKLNFENDSVEELNLILVEVLSNVDKYGGGKAEITIHEWSEKSEIIGIVIEVQDFGSGIENLEFAQIDGVSSANSLGIGLGTIKRFSDEFTISNGSDETENNGVIVVIKKRKTALPLKQHTFSSNSGSLYNWRVRGTSRNSSIGITNTVYWVDKIEYIIGVIVENWSYFDHPSDNSESLYLRIMEISNSLSIHDEIVELISEEIPENQDFGILKVNKRTNNLIYKIKGNVSIKIIPYGYNPKEMDDTTLLDQDLSDSINQFAIHEPLTLVCHSSGISSKWTRDQELLQSQNQSLSEFLRYITMRHARGQKDVSIIAIANW